ncbi:MAG: hypothetical protein JWN41_1598, partial [Thermoleophilia bacterium]|nr:hypothetical protein [Thermoleophilia bacterium]
MHCVKGDRTRLGGSPVHWCWAWGAVLVAIAFVCAAGATPASAHGVASKQYETVIRGIEPAGLPIEVEIVNGDQLRIENLGDRELVVCGYLAKCEPYARLGPSGVFVNHNSQAFFANVDTTNFGDVPDDAGQGPA